MSYTPTVVLDFDGVIHSYTSGWQGAGVVSDPAVPGIKEAIDKLRETGYKVVVVSTRCTSPEGMGAVRRFLRDNDIVVDDVMAEKPPALCYVDDRAICFNGDASTLVNRVNSFHSWTEQGFRWRPFNGMRPCVAVAYRNGKEVTIAGHFHGWGVDYEEFETGSGPFTTAIIETDDGVIWNVAASSVRFTDR